MSGDPRSGGPTPVPARCLDDAAYVLGSLSPVERQSYEQHLASCSRCQASVGRLAGLPGLLAVTSAADIGVTEVPVPESLLPGLLRQVARSRRRRTVLSSCAGAAAAAVLALVVVLALRPVSPAQQALPTAVQMQSLVAAPMNVSLQLSDKQWGTSVVVHCSYDNPDQPKTGYQLVAFDPAGKPQTLGWWTSVPGSATTVDTASSLHLTDIHRLEVQLPDGKPILWAVPPTR